MEFKAGQIFKSEKHASTITVSKIEDSLPFSKVTFKIEVPQDKWEDCTTWYSDVLAGFIEAHDFSLRGESNDNPKVTKR